MASTSLHNEITIDSSTDEDRDGHSRSKRQDNSHDFLSGSNSHPHSDGIRGHTHESVTFQRMFRHYLVYKGRTGVEEEVSGSEKDDYIKDWCYFPWYWQQASITMREWQWINVAFKRFKFVSFGF